MIQEAIDTWEQFEQRLRELKIERDTLADKASPIYVPELLFRGQADNSWSLDTTLERIKGGRWSWLRYFQIAFAAKPQIETFTQRRWKVPEFQDLEVLTRKYDSIWRALPAYDYLVYLRHHGFPSPLLDWTKSPYVAAYFAFSSAQSEKIAIYAFLETTGYGKSSSSGSPQIHSYGPYVRSHSRHFLQQSQYTIAARYDDEMLWFTSHEDVVAANSKKQDKLWKFVLPTTERAKVLRVLDEYNLNEFSLFQTDEALLRTIAIREIELEKTVP